MVDASVWPSDKQYTEPSGLEALAHFAKPDCPSRCLFLAALDLQLTTGMVWVYLGNGSVEGHTKLKYNLRI